MDILAIIAVLRALGIETGRMIESAFLFMMFIIVFAYFGYKYIGPTVKKMLTKADEALAKVDEANVCMVTMSKSVEALNHTLQEYMAQTDLRMSQGEEKFIKFDRDIENLKSQMEVLIKQQPKPKEGV